LSWAIDGIIFMQGLSCNGAGKYLPPENHGLINHINQSAGNSEIVFENSICGPSVA
jgi:hypothetical protein